MKSGTPILVVSGQMYKAKIDGSIVDSKPNILYYIVHSNNISPWFQLSIEGSITLVLKQLAENST
jgi:hypothetical protein